MEEVLAVLEQVKAFVLPHWPGFSWMFLAMLTGQVMKRVFTKEQAHKKRKSQWFWWWARKTMALHPAVAGALIGCFWQDPEGEDWPFIGSVLYFAFFGGMSVWAFEVLKGMAKKKGYDLSLPGQPEKEGEE